MPHKKQQNHQLRIIGGRWRGRKLAIAEVDSLRPTGDRIRETLFNWLQQDIADAHCLDLFAGSGALGLESLSRGAAHVTLLEKNKTAANQLKKHCITLATENANVVQTDSIHWLENFPLDKNSIDIVFIDPPFEQNLWAKTIAQLHASEALKSGALVYIESDKNKTIQVPDHWQIYRDKKAGAVHYQLFITKDS